MRTGRARHLFRLAGLVAGVGVGLWLWRRGVRTGARPREWTGPGDAAHRIQHALDTDPELQGRLRVHGISEGVVELTGRAPRREQRDRAVAMAHNVAGVHTVVNRVVLEAEQARLAGNRARRSGGPSNRQHYGMGVGMGTRRQSPETDPDRPSDRQELVDRELDVDRVQEGPPASGAGGDGGQERAADSGDPEGQNGPGSPPR